MLEKITTSPPKYKISIEYTDIYQKIQTKLPYSIDLSTLLESQPYAKEQPIEKLEKTIKYNADVNFANGLNQRE